jgi:hypothetical protein
MAGLKPIGSEKLEGMDKIRRIMEIARYNENTPQSTNESNSSEYRISLADGNSYEIIKERQGYIIKQSINESDADYIEPMQNRKYYSSYSQALKRLNLMTKEINTLYENEEGTSLFGEQKKKYILKTPKPKAAAPAAEPVVPEIPSPEASAELPPAPDMGAEMPPVPDMGGDAALPPAPDMGGEGEMPPAPDMGGEGEMPPAPEMGDDMGGEEEELDIDVEKKPKEKKVSDLKRIQILVGKLSQKIRSYEEEKELSAQNVKYVINSILSAIDVDVLDEDDIEEIIGKLEGGSEDDDESEDVSFEEEDIEEFNPEMEDEVPPPPAPGEEEPEMTETYSSYGEAVRDFIPAAYGNVALRQMSGEQTESDMGEVDEYHKERRRGHHYPEVDSFEHGTFGESSVDKVLSKYFILTEEEKVKKERRTNENYKQNKQNIIKLSESTEQLDSALDFVRENPRVKLMGVSNKGNLIFKEGINEVKITREGNII